MAHAIANAIIMPDPPPIMPPMATNRAVIPAIKMVVFKYPMSMVIYKERDKKMTAKKEFHANAK